MHSVPVVGAGGWGDGNIISSLSCMEPNQLLLHCSSSVSQSVHPSVRNAILVQAIQQKPPNRFTSDFFQCKIILSTYCMYFPFFKFCLSCLSKLTKYRPQFNISYNMGCCIFLCLQTLQLPGLIPSFIIGMLKLHSIIDFLGAVVYHS